MTRPNLFVLDCIVLYCSLYIFVSSQSPTHFPAMYTIILLLLTIWPFAPASKLGHRHSRAAHARHLRHIQESRAKRLSKCHGAHPSLIHFR